MSSERATHNRAERRRIQQAEKKSEKKKEKKAMKNTSSSSVKYNAKKSPKLVSRNEPNDDGDRKEFMATSVAQQEEGSDLHSSSSSSISSEFVKSEYAKNIGKIFANVLLENGWPGFISCESKVVKEQVVKPSKVCAFLKTLKVAIENKFTGCMDEVVQESLFHSDFDATLIVDLIRDDVEDIMEETAEQIIQLKSSKLRKFYHRIMRYVTLGVNEEYLAQAMDRTLDICIDRCDEEESDDFFYEFYDDFQDVLMEEFGYSDTYYDGEWYDSSYFLDVASINWKDNINDMSIDTDDDKEVEEEEEDDKAESEITGRLSLLTVNNAEEQRENRL